MRIQQLAIGTLLAGLIMATMPAEAGDLAPVASVEGITEYRLENGMKVLLFPDQSKPQVTVNLTIFVGSRHEGYGEAGMAHLLEHMVFKGTPDHPKVPMFLKDLGADFNGTTWLDRTNYFETIPASDKNLEAVLRLEADRMVNSYIKGEDLASEMTVVRNEFERGENSPSRILDQRMVSAAYEWHNYGKSTIGNRADIERVPVDNLKRFYQKYYQPDNAMVIIAGQFEPEKALGYVTKYFGAIPKPTRVLENTYTEEPAQDGERRVTLRRVGDVAIASAVYHICSGAHPDYVSLDTLEHILTSSPSGRLYKALVETRRAASVSGGAYALHDPGMFKLSAQVAAGNDPNEILATMNEIAESITENGVTEDEVNRAKTYWLKSWEMTLNDSQQVAIQLSDWAAQGDWRLMFLYRDRLEQVTPASVNEVAKKYLRRNNRTVGLFLPSKESERVSVPATPNLAEMIGEYKGREALAQGEAFEVTPENIQQRTQWTKLSTGLKVALLPKKTRGNTVSFRLSLRYGNDKTLVGKSAASELLPALMMRGTTKLSRQQIQDTLDQNSGRLSPSGSLGDLSFSGETKRKNLPVVLDILKQVLREPTLPADQLEIIRNAKLNGLQQQLSDPQSLARIAVSRKLSPYPATDVRYIPTTQEEIERWKAVTIDDVKALYQAFIGGQYGELVVVGDFSPDELVPQMEAILGSWKSNEPYARIERPTTKTTDIREVIETPDKENAVYLAATVLPMNDAAEDYPAMVIGNFVLGGGTLSSRLGDRVRQKEGLSYGVGSFLRASSLDDRTSFYMYAITNPVNMPKVEAAIADELSKALKDGFTSGEIESAKVGYLEQQKVEWNTDDALAARLAELLYAGRDMGYYSKQIAAMQGLTHESVNAVLKKRLDPKTIGVIVAGDFAKAAKAAAEVPKPEAEPKK
jgi:zinc protease